MSGHIKSHGIGDLDNHTSGTLAELNALISDETIASIASPVFGSITVTNDTTLSGDIILPKTSGKGIKVDTAIPTFGWRDITGALTIHEPGGGGADPTYALWKGNLRAYEFNSVGTDEMFIEFHMPHDYLPNSDIYIHAHWSHNSATVTTGNVRWDFEVSYAKGHDQEAFGTNVIATVSQAASTTQYQHMIAEVQLSDPTPSAALLDTNDLEVDGLILVRVTNGVNGMDGGAEPFLHMVDLHYQSTGIPTKNKAPNFYI